MDPLSLVFSTYLDVVTNVTHQKVEEVMGLEQAAVIVEHQGVSVSYGYQMWRIQPQSVCQQAQANVAQFSKCTQAASDLFSAVCQNLQSRELVGWKQKKLKSMYCQAAIGFKPTFAHVERAKEQTKLQQARTACNGAIAALVGESDPLLYAEKDKACRHYEELKRAPE